MNDLEGKLRELAECEFSVWTDKKFGDGTSLKSQLRFGPPAVIEFGIRMAALGRAEGLEEAAKVAIAEMGLWGDNAYAAIVAESIARAIRALKQ